MISWVTFESRFLLQLLPDCSTIRPDLLPAIFLQPKTVFPNGLNSRQVVPVHSLNACVLSTPITLGQHSWIVEFLSVACEGIARSLVVLLVSINSTPLDSDLIHVA